MTAKKKLASKEYDIIYAQQSGKSKVYGPHSRADISDIEFARRISIIAVWVVKKKH